MINVNSIKSTALMTLDRNMTNMEPKETGGQTQPRSNMQKRQIVL